jgi:AcrR family transcriptional regulator
MAQFTKKAIIESFIKLLNQKSLDKITVKEIVDDCGINRNTFYYHFEDIHALLTFLVDAEVQRVIEKQSDVNSMEEGFIEAANFALSNKRAIYHIYNSVSREELERYLNGIAEEVMRRMIDGLDLDKDVPEADRELLIHFYKSGMVGLVTGWLGEGMKYDPEQLIRSLGALLDGSVAAALDRSRERARKAPSV